MITLDFKNDWKEFLSKEMTELRFKYDVLISLEENTIRYLNAKRRIVSNKPRSIHESKELCIHAKHSEAYDNLKRLISEGRDLRPYLSRETRKANRNDLLLNVCGVHHLHFLPAGTKDILFVRFTDTDAYIIQAFPHGRDHSDVWVNTQLIEVLHNNWPEIIASYKLANIRGEYLATEERLTIRKNHGNAIINVSDSTCYFLGGIMASGTCIYDRINCDKIIAGLTEYEDWVKTNEDNFRVALKISEAEPLSIKLIIEDQEYWLYEPVRKARFQLLKRIGVTFDC
jgi:hypothetical protein